MSCAPATAAYTQHVLQHITLCCCSGCRWLCWSGAPTKINHPPSPETAAVLAESSSGAGERDACWLSAAGGAHLRCQLLQLRHVHAAHAAVHARQHVLNLCGHTPARGWVQTRHRVSVHQGTG